LSDCPKSVAFQGGKLTGPFDLDGNEARSLLGLPANPNGKYNFDLISRFYDIDDIVGRDSDRWAIGFGTAFSESDAALYEAPLKIIKTRVVPFRNDPEKCRSDETRPCPTVHDREAIASFHICGFGFADLAVEYDASTLDARNAHVEQFFRLLLRDRG
jgi:hypothetical protein